MTRRLIKWTLKDLCYCIDQMQENEFDCVIFIEGNRGLGKSTLGWKIAAKVKAPFFPKKDLCYQREPVIKALATKMRGIVFADEMINVAYNRDFYEEDQKQLLKALNMYRDSLNIFIGCIPRFITLDTQIREICKIRITVVRRGIALIQLPVKSIYTTDRWDIKNNMKIESKWFVKGTKNPRYSQLTTVKGILFFGALRKKQRALYEKVKFEKRNRIYQLYEEQDKSPEEVFYENLLERVKVKAMTPQMFNEVCLIAGRKYKSVQKRINDLLREGGITQTFKDLVSIDNVKVKKDKLGFLKVA